MLEPADSYIKTDNEEEPANFPLKSDLIENADYKLIKKKLWRLIKDEFGHDV